MSIIRVLMTPTFIREANESSCPQKVITQACGEIQSDLDNCRLVCPLDAEIGLLPKSGFYEHLTSYKYKDHLNDTRILFLRISKAFPITLWRLWDCRCNQPDWANSDYQPLIQMDGHIVHASYVMAVVKVRPDELPALVDRGVK